MNNKAFTLIEMMVAMAIFSIIMAGIIAAFHEQMKLHSKQQKVSEMQQDARTAMYVMSKELKMAGFDPTGTADTGIKPVANRHDIVTLSKDVTGGESDGMDNDGDGKNDNSHEKAFGDGKTDDSNEVITYALKNGNITRASGKGSPQTLAANIDVLDLEYFGLNPLDPLCKGHCHLDLAWAAANPDAIRIVQVSIISQSGPETASNRFYDRDDSIYCNQLGKIILNKQIKPDRVRRLMLSTEIRLRNQGLK
ncbi:MAG: prepilin-type N-terminal cleavage/methylation domain-containing protein [Deltaproteobacteria bacterium]